MHGNAGWEGYCSRPKEGKNMLDYSFWNEPEVVAARADVLAAAQAFESGHVEEPSLERAVILFNEVVVKVRTHLGYYKKDKEEDGLTEEQYQMVLGWYLDDSNVAPPQTAVLVNARTRLLEAVGDLRKPAGKWEREFILNMCCMRYVGVARSARRDQEERERAWRKTKPTSNMNMESLSLIAGS